MDYQKCGTKTEISGVLLDAKLAEVFDEICEKNGELDTDFRKAPYSGKLWTRYGKISYCSYSKEDTHKIIDIMSGNDTEFNWTYEEIITREG